MFYDIYDCDEIGSVTSHSEINIVISPKQILVFLSLGNPSIAWASKCNKTFIIE
jgi:hypothetical protein